MQNTESELHFSPLKESKDPSLKIILGSVILFHTLLILYAAWIGPSSIVQKQQPPPRFLVQTVEITPQPSFVAISLEPRIEPPLKNNPEIAPLSSPEKEEPLTAEIEPIQEPKPTPKAQPVPKPPEQFKKAEPPKKMPPPKKEPPKKTPPPPKKNHPAPTPKTIEPKKIPIKNPQPQKTKQEKPKQEPAQDTELQKKLEAERLAEGARQEKLLMQAQERIAKIGKSSDKVSATKLNNTALALNSQPVLNLQVDTLPSVQGGPGIGDREMSYREEISDRLKLLLRLPEYGDVKVKLKLNRSGKVVSVTIISAESVKNRKYVEKTLPEMSFPAFGSNFGSASEYVFSITLSNEL